MNDSVSGFLTELVGMLESGRTLLSSLTDLASKQKEPGLRTTIERVAESIKKGSSLAAAMADHPTVFDPGYVVLIGVFERQM